MILVVLVLLISGTALAAIPAGTPGPDRIDSVNGVADTVRCGGGRDVVVSDQKDRVAADCEVVTRRIALDSTTVAGPQHRAIVEPSAAGDGRTVVTVFQTGRYDDGGSAAIGWATTVDGGVSWRRGILADAGADRISDPVVARDAVHGMWVAAALSVGRGVTSILVFRSTNGLDWSPPVVAASAVPLPREAVGLDKDWLGCDNRPASPHRGTCYLAYTDLTAGRLGLQTTADAGATWGAAVSLGSQGRGGPIGAIPAVEPDGTLVVVYATPDLSSLEAVTSADGGGTFSAAVPIAAIRSTASLLRAPPLPSVAETAGSVVVAWPDCSARPNCAANDIAISGSTDGRTWSAPHTIAAGGDYLTPTIGAAGDAVAVVAYTRLDPSCCRLGVQLFRSTDGGVTWGRPTRLDARPMQIPWLGRSLTDGAGGFLGDYQALAFTGSRPMPVFVAALQPSTAGLRQDLYATTRLR